MKIILEHEDYSCEVVWGYFDQYRVKMPYRLASQLSRDLGLAVNVTYHRAFAVFQFG